MRRGGKSVKNNNRVREENGLADTDDDSLEHSQSSDSENDDNLVLASLADTVDLKKAPPKKGNVSDSQTSDAVVISQSSAIGENSPPEASSSNYESENGSDTKANFPPQLVKAMHCSPEGQSPMLPVGQGVAVSQFTASQLLPQ